MSAKAKVSPEDLAALIWGFECGGLPIEEKWELFINSGWRRDGNPFEQLARSKRKGKGSIHKLKRAYYNTLRSKKEQVFQALEQLKRDLREDENELAASSNTTPFGNTNNPSIPVENTALVGASAGVFAGQGTFTNSASAFGQTTVSSSFNSSARPSSSFATLATSAQPLLAASSNTTPFGNTNNPSIPVENTAFVNPGIPSTGDFGQPSSVPGPFGNATEPPEKFENNPSPFNSTATAPPNNHFLPKSQLSGEAFGQSPLAGAGRDEATDDNFHNADEDLSEDDKENLPFKCIHCGKYSNRTTNT